ncbi:MAG: hypothetical protein EBY16_07790 [Gammaproteobacteria bacterium]|nr:hypothetical protein [Gammaproteobacteria bacterium]
MDNQELKQAIIDDIEFLKTAKIGILDKNIYYSRLKKYAWRAFSWMYFPTLIIGFLVFIFTTKSHLRHDFLADYLIDCVIVSLLMPVFALVAYFTKIMNWIVFEEFLLPHLKTKDMIRSYLRKFITLTLKLYLVWLVIGMILCGFESTSTVVLQLLAFVGLHFIMYLMVYAELNRIGASVFFEYLSSFFGKETNRLSLK